ncbi:hypothetical protein Lsan_4026 [Legionella santicrucis]|uniref:RiboL-PSP-HEPN domain-containing protein n=1 Tax=Legionella santicrucis TaxID=45074 RepID=A0A0W0Y9Y1_9GAMM|nr:hypothetical protein [Legionella santicrucis]KTD53616.1 hypothetical protein Lsan_4026 [Legionella santicrucis]
MDQFKSLTTFNFEYLLKIYDLVTQSIHKDISHLESKKNINKLSMNEIRNLAFYKQSLDILIESTFLQIYAELEEALYHGCEKQLIKKNASISRFETALNEQGYLINSEHWKTLLNISKIRNCLLHANGRIDIDKYGIDTKETIKTLNSDANIILIEILNLKGNSEGTSKIKIKEEFLNYCVIKIKNFIYPQK